MIDFHHHMILKSGYNHHQCQNMMMSIHTLHGIKTTSKGIFWGHFDVEYENVVRLYEDDKNLTILLTPRNDCATSDSVDQPGRR